MAAARRKGKWGGGLPVLGYDIGASSKRLVINEAEAVHVRAIFALYLQHRGLLAVLEELARRGWRTKQTRTEEGRVHGGRSFTRSSLYRLLTNITYIGQVRYHSEIHPGEQPALIESKTWQEVQALLVNNGSGRTETERTPSEALLQGLLFCQPCGCAMTPAQVSRGNRRYRYYTCSAAQRKGWHNCPSKSLPAGAVERYVLEQIASCMPGGRRVAANMVRLRAASSSATVSMRRKAGSAMRATVRTVSGPQLGRPVRGLSILTISTRSSGSRAVSGSWRTESQVSCFARRTTELTSRNGRRQDTPKNRNAGGAADRSAHLVSLETKDFDQYYEDSYTCQDSKGCPPHIVAQKRSGSVRIEFFPQFSHPRMVREVDPQNSRPVVKRFSAHRVHWVRLQQEFWRRLLQNLVPYSGTRAIRTLVGALLVININAVHSSIVAINNPM
jgi:hypothetical protein